MGGSATPLDLAVGAAGGDPARGLAGRRQDDDARASSRACLREDMRKKVLLVSCDVYRPAAIEQLEDARRPGRRRFLSVVARRGSGGDRARRARLGARHYHDVVIVDTAGRLAIDEAMMREIAALHAAVKPVETLFVVDAMQGQDAVNTARRSARLCR